jgi:hypothetical protein
LSGNHRPSSQRPLSVFPFRSDPEDDIIAFDVYFRDDNGRRIIFIAHRRALLSLATSSTTSGSQGALASGGPPPVTRAWTDWGPRTTHWTELDPLNDTISLAGSRCVLVKYSHLRDHFVLDLRDFNPYRVRARSAPINNDSSKIATATPAAAVAGGATAVHQAVLSAERCFEEDVVSELPFVSIRKENVGSRVFLDDEWMAEILVRRLLFIYFALSFSPMCANPVGACCLCDRQWDQDAQAQIIQFRTVVPPAEPFSQ